jgi:lipoate-protein ligase A
MDALLITDSPRVGVWNMGIDEALREWTGRQGTPVVRFYEWAPATLSLGYFQNLCDRSLHTSSRDLQVVRRASGGGAIVHDRELTYSCSLPMAGRWGADGLSLVDAFHATLCETLGAWGIAASLCRSPAPVPREAEPFLCFQRRADGDLLLDGMKIAGSAQRRLQGSLLQHGSVLLRQSPAAPELPGIEELAGRPVRVDDLRSLWAERLSRRLGWTFVPCDMPQGVRERAAYWIDERFGAERWTARR